MKRWQTPQALFVPAVFLLIVVNGVVLGGVAYNRTGLPEAAVVLSERELPLPYRIHEENSGLALRLDWRVLEDKDDIGRWRSSPAWFTADKLKTLGFELDENFISEEPRRYHKEALPRMVYIVLELDGQAYREALSRTAGALEKARRRALAHPSDEKHQKELEQAETAFARERTAASRLFAVDAGRDPAILRAAYPDQTRYVITRGLVSPSYHYEKKRTWITGHIRRLMVESIHVPLDQRKHLAGALSARVSSGPSDVRPPRYTLELAYGRRFEPWIVRITPLTRH